MSHLVGGELAGRVQLKAVQVKLQQLRVGEDGCVQEARAACRAELQLGAQLQQQTKHVRKDASITEQDHLRA